MAGDDTRRTSLQETSKSLSLYDNLLWHTEYINLTHIKAPLGLSNNIQDGGCYEQSINLTSLYANHATAILPHRHLHSLDTRRSLCYCHNYCWSLPVHVSLGQKYLSSFGLFSDPVPWHYSIFPPISQIEQLLTCIQSRPVHKAWNKHLDGHCYNLVNAWYTNAVFSITTDILILILPMHMVYKLQRDKREKLLLYAVFGLGIL